MKFEITIMLIQILLFFRWVVRIKSLKTVRANYTQLMQFFHDRSVDKEVDSAVAAKASGFYDYMETFQCVFYLTMMIEIFDRIEILNKELQKADLCVIESYGKIEAVADILGASRDSKFEEIWQKSLQAVGNFGLDEPQIPRQRKVPRRLDSGTSETFKFETPKVFYRKSYFEVFDQLVASLKSRFDNDSARFFKLLERFAVGQPEDVEVIAKFYKDDFDQERLLNDRDMFLQLLKRQNETAKNLREVVDFFQKYEWMRGLVPEFVRFVTLLVTIPGSSCSNERSFSVLRRVKTYLRSTMLQDRLNNIAILHVYSDMTDNLDLEELLNKFISRNTKRSAVFALRN